MDTDTLTVVDDFEQVSDDVEEKEEKTEPDWAHSLSDVTGVLEFEEFGKYKYQYMPVLNPDGEQTKYYVAFFKDVAESTSWVTAAGLLSSQYAVVMSEKIAEELSKNLTLQNRRIRGNPFLLSYYAETDKADIKIFEDDCAKTIFQLISGMDPAVLEKAASRVALTFINSYNGTRGVKIDYALNLASNVEGMKYHDYFILSHFGHKFKHRTANISNITTDLMNIQDYCDISITSLKQVKERVVGKSLDDFATEVGKKFGLSSKKLFSSYWSMIPPDQKNLLSLLIITSRVLDSEYTPKTHANLYNVIRPAVHDVMTEAFKK